MPNKVRYKVLSVGNQTAMDAPLPLNLKRYTSEACQGNDPRS